MFEIKLNNEKKNGTLRAHLVHVFKYIFSIFKQHYTYFYTFFIYTYFQKIQTILLK